MTDRLTGAELAKTLKEGDRVKLTTEAIQVLYFFADVEVSAFSECFLILFLFFTPPQNRDGVIFSLKIVSVCVCLSVNTILAELMHQFQGSFC